jgi:uncharacterized protein YabN with tetrapyrrole methylase and pyrophosphatase domain
MAEETAELKLKRFRRGAQAGVSKPNWAICCFTVVNLGRHLGVDAEMALRNCNLRFRRASARWSWPSPRPLEELSPNELEALWEQAKTEARGRREAPASHPTQTESQAQP